MLIMHCRGAPSSLAWPAAAFGVAAGSLTGLRGTWRRAELVTRKQAWCSSGSSQRSWSTLFWVPAYTGPVPGYWLYAAPWLSMLAFVNRPSQSGYQNKVNRDFFLEKV